MLKPELQSIRIDFIKVTLEIGQEKYLLILFWKPDSQSKNKVKVVLDFSNYATKKKLEHTTGIDTSDLAAKKDFIPLKAEVDKLDINKVVNIPTSFNNLKTKVNDFMLVNEKAVPVDLK